MVKTECQTVFKIQTWMVGIFTYTLFSHVVYIQDSTMMIAFLVISAGTFPIADSSFAIANQYSG